MQILSIDVVIITIFTETAMGVKIGAQKDPDQDYVRALHEGAELLLVRRSKPWLWMDWLYYLTSDGKHLNELIKTCLHPFTRRIIKERKKDKLKFK